MGKLKAPQQKELGYIPIAEFVAHAAKQHLKDNIGGDLDKIEGCGSPFIEGSAALLTAKHGVAQTGVTLQGRKSS